MVVTADEKPWYETIYLRCGGNGYFAAATIRSIGVSPLKPFTSL
jgi:hypothetical protein